MKFRPQFHLYVYYEFSKWDFDIVMPCVRFISGDILHFTVWLPTFAQTIWEGIALIRVTFIVERSCCMNHLLIVSQSASQYDFDKIEFKLDVWYYVNDDNDPTHELE